MSIETTNVNGACLVAVKDPLFFVSNTYRIFSKHQNLYNSNNKLSE